jgi:hypothetical protein
MGGHFGHFERDETPLHGFSRLFTEFNLQPRDASSILDIKQRGFYKGGYFAFPPPSPKENGQTVSPDTSDTHDQLHGRAPLPHFENASHQNSPAMDGNVAENDEVEQRQMIERQKRLEKEREVATHGEIEWVRSGGVLRDAQGRRDKVHTDRIRYEIRLQKREKLLKERWEMYERKWGALLASDDRVSFKDMPWPLQRCPSSVGDLTFKAISDFLLEPLEIRTNTVTKRERIRTSLLRWHPDKMSSVLCRVVEEDVGIVREGVGAVFMCLKSMKEN